MPTRSATAILHLNSFILILLYARNFSLVPQEHHFVSAFSLSGIDRAYKPVVVVGKIIIDEYGNPYPGEDPATVAGSVLHPPISVSIGGGGPQAAFGAASALAVWDTYFCNHTHPTTKPSVLFLAPVGKDWTEAETSALASTLNSTLGGIATTTRCFVPDTSNRIHTHLIQCDHGSNGYVTPRIRLWHDSDQVVHWYDINDSFGPKGADGLWRNRPSAEDLVSVLAWNSSERQDFNLDNGIVLHVIAEAGKDASGGQLDCLPLIQDSLLEKHLSFVGIEPVASGQSLGEDDARSASNILQKSLEARLNSPLLWCPDSPLHEQMDEYELYGNREGPNCNSLFVAVRDGPRGSQIWSPWSNATSSHIPAAKLSTVDGEPLDPTGAGNAYSAAMTALLGNHVPMEAASSIASAVGAVVCEHKGLPTSNQTESNTWERIVHRIYEAVKDVGDLRGQLS